MSLYLNETTSIVFKTIPYIIMRAAIYLAFGVAFMIYFFLVFLMGRAFSGIAPQAEGIIWFLGLVVSFPLTKLAREYLLYLVKAGHVAVISQLVTEGKLPDGVNQVSYGKSLVVQHFKQSSILFLLDRTIHGVITALSAFMMRMTDFLSAVPGIDGLRKLIRGILYFSLSYVDEAILARYFVKPTPNPWINAREGIVLYAQAWKSFLSAALVAGFISIISFPLFLIITLAPALAASIGHAQERWLYVMIGVIAAWLLKSILIEPFTLTLMIVTYLKETKT
ncbi:MAG: hypothetical protein IPJ69_05650 [Deltaproteobacteria bacterium]|nr:MAG: hypothetical protein IPJ69_05650 [Deltaproteobacteria bacterium]